MTDHLFPPDVSLRLSGETAAAQALIPLAKQLLFKTLARKDHLGVPNVNGRIITTAGDVITVTLAGDLKIVNVQPAPRHGPVPRRALPPVPEHGYQIFENDMWSGVARGYATTQPTVTTGTDSQTGDAGFVLDKFHPDQECAAAYAIAFEWQTPNRLAVTESGTEAAGVATSAFPKASNYSGAMKRVVAAVLGLGNTYSETEDIDGNTLPDSPDVHIRNLYDYSWLKTHGIYKGNDGGIWLVQIGKVDGVLARLLPLLDDTDTEAFIGYIDSLGDTDTLNVLFEFGGLPSSETFPTGTSLTDAIARGDILQLMDAATIEPFYRDTVNSVNKQGLWAGNGWAFSASGAKATNVCMWYKNIAIAQADSGDWATDGFAGAAADVRYMMSQLWTIDIALELSTEGPVGIGTANLTLVEGGPLANQRANSFPATLPEFYNVPMLRAPNNSNSDRVELVVFPGRVESYAATDALLPPMPVLSFYVNETIEVVRFVPRSPHSFDPGSFRGDTLDMGIVDGGAGSDAVGCVGMLAPAFCREGYILVKADLTPYDPGDPADTLFPITQAGFFSDLGVILLPQLDEFFYSDQLFGGAYAMQTWMGRWLTRGETIVTYPTPMDMKFGVTVNPGKSGGFVTNNGADVPSNRIDPGGGVVSRPAYTDIAQAPELEDLEIPAQTPASNVSFVGCP